MKIDKRLNLVVPISRDDGTEFYTHSMPVPTLIFNQFKGLAMQTMNALYTRGYGQFSPRYAAQMLKDIAAENADGEAEKAKAIARVENGFLLEMRRLTNVFALTDKGWEMVPLYDAQKSGLIDEDDADEVENAVVFFTLASRAHLKSQQSEVRGALSLWNARIESLSCTEFMKSLTTPIADASTGAKATPS